MAHKVSILSDQQLQRKNKEPRHHTRHMLSTAAGFIIQNSHAIHYQSDWNQNETKTHEFVIFRAQGNRRYVHQETGNREGYDSECCARRTDRGCSDGTRKDENDIGDNPSGHKCDDTKRTVDPQQAQMTTTERQR